MSRKDISRMRRTLRRGILWGPIVYVEIVIGVEYRGEGAEGA